MKKNLFFYFFIFLSHYFVEAQSFGTLTTGPMGGLGQVFHNSSSTKIVDGDPNLYDSWVSGTIIMMNGDTYSFDSMNYHIHGREILFREKQASYSVTNKEEVDYIYLAGKTFMYFSFEKNSTLEIFQVLLQGDKISLLKKYNCSLSEGVPSNGMIPAKNAKYSTSSGYFYLDKGIGYPISLSLKKDAVAGIMTDEKAKVVDYIKTEKLKLKKEKDLISVFEFYNSMYL